MINFKGIVECGNEEYHSEKKHLSSSNLKLLLKDVALFHDQKILGNSTEYSTSTLNAFAEGSYAHTLILEPHMAEKEYKIFPGFRKQGKDWEAFKQKYKDSGLVLLSKSQKAKVERWVKSYDALAPAKNLIKGGFSEHTLFDSFMDVSLKVRADYINVDEGYIADVKTTSGFTDIDSFKHTIQSFEYDLSAALYCMLFKKYYKKDFDFYFIVLGKRDHSCEVFKISDSTMVAGESKVINSLNIYKKCLSSGVWTSDKAEFSKNILQDTDYEIKEV